MLGIEEVEEKIETPRAPPPVAPEPMKPTEPLKVTPTSDGELDISDKALSSICYLLPLLDGLKFGKFLFTQFPLVTVLLAPLKPVIDVYYGLGFFNIIVFFALYFGVARNNQLGQYIRFNASQAILLDIIMILPEVLASLFQGINGAPTSGLGLEVQIIYYNTIFWIIYLSASYGIIQCVRGKQPRIPFISDAADQQSGGRM
eukprot:CAMPEP_0196582546 /NCGR_PEP_ID=MMETSP1081-20130531/39446_1 /TAXON_ID=36882 /ORGANISM="Pyramimonas amylifera, Strain CCMP720" /LENGTH=201 /DNA_ID=CAMNT_0041903147 /DNA_START=293 /DNA_END=898 /DNA_ORIENTATION=+